MAKNKRDALGGHDGIVGECGSLGRGVEYLQEHAADNRSTQRSTELGVLLTRVHSARNM